MSEDLEYLWRAAAAAERALAAGARDVAGSLIGRTLEALDRELEARGSTVRQPAMFEALLLAAQQSRTLVPVPVKKESVDVEGR